MNVMIDSSHSLTNLGLCIVMARALGLASTAPGWGLAVLGRRTRLMLAAALAVVSAPAAERVQLAASLRLEFSSWCVLLVGEWAVGAVLGLAAALVVAGARQAGELVAAQAGLSPGSVLCPDADGSGEAATPLGALYGLLALAIFLGLDGPLILVDALVGSYEWLAPGFAGGLMGNAQTDDARGLAFIVFDRVGEGLALALRAAAPVGLALFFAGVIMALLVRGGRAGAGAWAGLSWPARGLLALALLVLTLPGLAAALRTAWMGWVTVYARGS